MDSLLDLVVPVVSAGILIYMTKEFIGKPLSETSEKPLHERAESLLSKVV
jgi:hypothetical protein